MTRSRKMLRDPVGWAIGKPPRRPAHAHPNRIGRPCGPVHGFNAMEPDYIDGFVGVDTGQIVFSDGRLYEPFRRRKNFEKHGIEDDLEPGLYRVEVAITAGSRTDTQRETNLAIFEMRITDGILLIHDPANVIYPDDWQAFLEATRGGDRLPPGTHRYNTYGDGRFEISGSVVRVR